MVLPEECGELDHLGFRYVGFPLRQRSSRFRPSFDGGEEAMAP